MKKLYAILFIVALVHTGVYGQAKKPTIMVVPANVWCTHNGYVPIMVIHKNITIKALLLKFRIIKRHWIMI